LFIDVVEVRNGPRLSLSDVWHRPIRPKLDDAPIYAICVRNKALFRPDLEMIHRRRIAPPQRATAALFSAIDAGNRRCANSALAPARPMA